MTSLNAVYVKKDPVYDMQLATKQFVDTSVGPNNVTEILKTNAKEYDFNDSTLDNVTIVILYALPAVGVT